MTTTTTKIKLTKSQLNSLSQLELAAIARKLGEIEEAEKSKRLDSFLETANEAQLAFLKSTAKLRLLLLGNRGGKSTVGCAEDLFRLTGRHPFLKCPVPVKGCLVASDFESAIKNIIEPKILQWAPPKIITKIERNQQGAARRMYFSTGSILDFYSWDQDQKVFEGSDYDFAHFDEPPPRMIFNAVWRGLTDRGGIAYITGTPLTEPWLYQLYKRFEEGDPDIWAYTGSTEVNAKNLGEGDEELGKKRIQQMASMYDDDEKAARLDGKFLQMQGLIFKGWQRKHHLIEPFDIPQSWPITESIDPHPRKPWAVVWIAHAPNGCKILVHCTQVEGVIEDVAGEIVLQRQNLPIEHGKPARISRTLIDNYASAPLMSRTSTQEKTERRRSIREELEEHIGPRGAGGPRVVPAPKNVAQKIDIFRSWLRIEETKDGPRSEFYVFDTGDNRAFVDEIEGYVWDTKRGGLRAGLKDRPVKERDDLVDAVLQVALTEPKTSAPHLGPIPIAKGLERYGISRGR